MGKKKFSLRIAKAEASRYLKLLKEDGVLVRGAYLFGSFVRGEQKPDSDLDLLVSVKGFKDWVDAGGCLQKKLFGFKSKMDIDVVAHVKERLDSGIPLENEVLQHGIKLI